MARALKQKVRAKNKSIIVKWLENHPCLDIVATCSELGKAIFWSIPYKLNEVFCGEESVIELTIKWDEAKEFEILDGRISVCNFPTEPFSSKYNRFFCCGNSSQGSLSFNTSGGYRYLINLNAFEHFDSEAHKNMVRDFAESDPRY